MKDDELLGTSAERTVMSEGSPPENVMDLPEKNALDYAKLGADTLIRKYTAVELPPKNQFLYHQGVFLAGVERLRLLSGEKKYYDYIKDWCDLYIDSDGNILHSEAGQFDYIQPAILLFSLYKDTGDTRYKKALDSVVPLVEQWPCNARGGYWHKSHRKNQMWLDSLYMIGPFQAMYARNFDKPYFYEKVYRQMDLMRRNMTDPRTGLLYHAWDDSAEVEWADKITGLSDEFWGRAIGWYAVAILEILDYLPEDDPRRRDFIDAELAILNALVRFQDQGSGLWYQVVDKGDDPRNWHETSCSCLFAYAIAKAAKKGLVHKAWLRHAEHAYRGVIEHSVSLEGNSPEGGELLLSGICVGTNVGDYEHYLKRPTVVNDLHGMGAFLFMCTEYYNAVKALG
jgi:unsaturated rhamnogalacturonyl hydrolase